MIEKGGILAEKTKLLRSVNDFIIGIALLVLGLYVMFTTNLIQGNVPSTAGGVWIRPDTWVRFIGVMLAFFSLILTIKSFNFKREAKTEPFLFVISWEVVLTTLLLVIYAFLLPIIGFGVSTFLLLFLMVCLFFRKEKSGDGKPAITKKEIIRTVIIAAVFSLIMDVVVYQLFSRVLNVVFP
jgi:hypothetical protein